MPIPSPRKGQSKNDFISSCMSDDVMNSEFSDSKQRYAICISKWEEKTKNASEIIVIHNDEFIFEEND